MNKVYQRIFSAIVVIAITISLLPALRVNADEIASGTCGENVSWTLDDEGTLTVSGSGPMEDFDWNNEKYGPWCEDYGSSIKNVIIEKGVTTIGDAAFYGLKNLSDVSISEGVTSIGEVAFYECSELTDIEIPEGITVIKQGAFTSCTKLSNVAIPNSLITIEGGAFLDCSILADVTLPEGLKTIGSFAFGNCEKIIDLVIPTSVEELGDFALINCTGLESVVITYDLYEKCDNKRVFTGTDPVIIQGLDFGYCGDPEVDDGTNIFWRIDNEGNLYLFGSGEMADWDYSSTVAPWKKDNKYIYKVVIEDDITTIGSNAFRDLTFLEEATVSKGATSIGTSAFAGCTKLNKVTIDKGLKEDADSSVFEGCPSDIVFNYYKYTIAYQSGSNGHVKGVQEAATNEIVKLDFTFNGGYTVKEVTYTEDGITKTITPNKNGNYYFTMPYGGTTVTASFMPGGDCGAQGGNVKWFIDDEGILTIFGSGDMKSDYQGQNNIPWYQFRNTVKGIKIEDGVTSISNAAFMNLSNCESTTVEIPDSVTTIGSHAFAELGKLNTICIPGSVTTIGPNAFYRCTELQNVTLSEGITTIGAYAFQTNRNLKKIVIPSSVTNIGKRALSICDKLEEVTMDSSLITQCINGEVFYSSNPELKIYYSNITYTPDENGEVSGYATVNDMNTVNLTVTPDAGYLVDQVTVTDSKGTTVLNPGTDDKYSFTMPSGDVTVKATFKLPPKTVTFADEDGTVLQSGLVDCGTNPVYTGTTPAKAETDTYTYTFAGWDDGSKTYGPAETLPAVAADVTYTAVFTETAKPGPDPTPAPTPDPTPAPTPGPTPGPTPEPTPAPDPDAATSAELMPSGTAHVQDAGDVPISVDPATGILTLGTTGQSKRLEEIVIDFENTTEYEGTMEYRVHIQDKGWTDWITAGDPAGTVGQSKRIEAIEIRLTGELADYYSVEYCVHIQDYGDMQGWVADGALAGTTGESKRIEQIKVRIVPKGSDDSTSVKYRVHIEDLGWESAYASDGKMAGTSGQSKRLEAIEIFLEGCQYSGGVQYKTHVQNIGWESSWTKNGEMSGTQGQALRLEGISIELYGEVADYYDIYYRVHAQDIGWMGWAKNGAYAGTAGRSARIEGIQIVLVPKGDPAPGATYEGITSVTEAAFVEGF